METSAHLNETLISALSMIPDNEVLQSSSTPLNLILWNLRTHIQNNIPQLKSYIQV